MSGLECSVAHNLWTAVG